jgi:thiol-disulfide isomerase/thioredoxin
MHAHGIANAQLRDLSPDLQKHFNYNAAKDVKPTTATADIRFRELNAPFAPSKEALAKSSAHGAHDDDVQVPKLYAKSFLHHAAPPLIVSKWLNGAPDTKGKFILIDFWATWCPPCRAELPHLEQVYQDYQKKGVKVFAINVDAEKSRVPAFVAEHNLTMPVLLDDQTTNVSGGKYKVQAIPVTVVIGKDGKIRKIFVGFGEGSEEQLRAAIDAANK